MRNSLLTSAFALALHASAPLAVAQIDVVELSDAQDYAAGLLDVGNGGLDRNAWQGTSAMLAARLIADLPQDVSHPVAKALIDAALLSGGVPPDGDDAARDAFAAARNDYLLATGQGARLSALAARDRDLAQTPRLQTDLALNQGDTDAACTDSDGMLDNRSEPYWAKLRAFCHVLRDEIPAAELTADLVRASGHEDAVFFELLNARILGKSAKDIEVETPLHKAMLTSPKTDAAPEDMAARLDGLLDRMEDVSPDVLLADILALASGEADEDGGVPDLDFEDADADSSPTGTARLYVLAVQARSAPAALGLLSRMERAGRLTPAASHMSGILQTLPPQELVAGELSTLAKATVIANDIGLLTGLYQALPDGSAEARRLAIVADALGGGFRLTPAGEDLEAPLLAGEAGAVRDIVIALGLGALISDEASLALSDADLDASGMPLAELLTLSAAGAEQSRAEVALRSASLLSADVDAYTLGQVIKALQASGLDSFARQVAAYDYASRI